MIVNLNCLCKVQLNKLGKQIWLSQIDAIDPETAEKHPEIAEAIRSMIKEDDTVSAELWTIMNVFGPYISIVTCPFTTVTMELDKNPNFGNHFTNIRLENESEEITNDKE